MLFYDPERMILLKWIMRFMKSYKLSWKEVSDEKFCCFLKIKVSEIIMFLKFLMKGFTLF